MMFQSSATPDGMNSMAQRTPALEAKGQDWQARIASLHVLEGGASSSASVLPRAEAAYSATGRRGPPGGPQLRVSPCHMLDDGVLTGAEVLSLGWMAIGAAPERMPAWNGGDAAWLLQAACREAQSWRAAAPGALGLADIDLRVQVVLPPLRGTTEGLPDCVRAALEGACLPAGLLDVALHCADLDHEGPDLPLLAAALRDVGVGVVADGVQDVPRCLTALRRLPLTGLRLHPNLVRDMEARPDARMRVERAIGFAHASGAHVVALGVQTHVQRDILADLGCDEAHGPAFAPVMRAEAFRAALVEQSLLF